MVKRTLLSYLSLFLSIFFLSPYMCKDKDHPKTDHEGNLGEYNYSCTLSLISALDGVSGQSHGEAA